MKQVIGLRFSPNDKIHYYDHPNVAYALKDKVIVQLGDYKEMATVVVIDKACQQEDVTLPAKDVLRKATQQDLTQTEMNKIDAEEAFKMSKEIIQKSALSMKVINAQYSLERDKLTFLFSAEKRVDFRVLVRELAAIFRTRIELRQIGSRDEAKILGGLGPCGRPLCCSTFLGDFVPVSIKMAKNQGLSLNNDKLTGICGRLMCCLSFEDDMYEELKRSMPDYGEKIETPLGHGKVVGIQLLTQVIKVRLAKEQKTIEYSWEELQGSVV